MTLPTRAHRAPGRGRPAVLREHHLAYDPEQRIGFGEYTFRGRRQYHGIVAVQIRGDRIARWREYQYPDDADWDQFVGDSRFDPLRT